MTFKVRVRITNEAADSARAAGEPWLDNPHLKALATLCESDPLVFADHTSYVLCASVLDELEDAPYQALRAAADELLQRLNGTACIVLNSYIAARLTGQIRTSKGQAATASVKFCVYAPRDFGSLDATTFAVALSVANKDPMLNGVLVLLGNEQPAFVWFDLWRVWEALQTRAGSKDKFLDWVGDEQKCLDFERSANDSDVSGAYARHGPWKLGKREATNAAGLPVRQRMSSSEATQFIHGLVRRWIEEAAGQQLVVESPQTG